MTNINKADWPIRKIVYIVFGVALFVAITTGWVTEDQIETALSTSERVTAYLASAGLIFAATKTHRGSDDKNTETDVLNAAMNAAQQPATNDANEMLLEQLQRQIADLSHLIEHPAKPEDAVDETAPGIYPSGE
jgi:predicted DNA-binding ArsR family transcriptional regulator